MEKKTPYVVHVSEVLGRNVVVKAADKIGACEYAEELCNSGEINITHTDLFGSRSVEAIRVASADDIKSLDVYEKGGRTIIRDRTRKKGDYFILHRIAVGNYTVEIGVDEKAGYGMKYVVAVFVGGEKLDPKRTVYTNDEPRAMAAFGRFLSEIADNIAEEDVKACSTKLIADFECTPITEEDNLFGKVVVLRPIGDEKSASEQVYIAVGGSQHCLRCARVSDGTRYNFDREHIMGILRKDCYPDWVTEKLKCITDGNQPWTDYMEV